MRRYIFTGAPGGGKSTILAALRDRGYAVVDEAATDVIAREQARGRSEPWTDGGFVDAIAVLQRERQQRPGARVQLFDRSPVCTLALARYGGQAVTPVLRDEVDRVVGEEIYERRVFFVHLLGSMTRTAARRITYPQALRFERFHVEAYRECGFDLVDVPAAPLGERVDLIDGYLTAWAAEG